MSFLYFLLVSCLLLSPIAALPAFENTPSTPLPPSQDPFYTAPPYYESTAPGTVLRLRVVPGNLTSVVANCSLAYNILYRTTDNHYKPSWAVTTLYIPSTSNSSSHTSNPEKQGNALLSYQYPYNSVDVDASPSYAFYAGAPSDLENSLGRGWWVSVPDYEGPNTYLFSGVYSGYATIDSIRAVLSANLGLTPDTRYAMWGYSGGSIPSEWASELAVQYAPELNFSGMAIGGLVVNASAEFITMNGSLYAGNVVNALVGLSNSYPEVYTHLNNTLKPSGPYNRTIFFSVRKLNALQNQVLFASQDIGQYFINGFADILSPVMEKVLNKEAYMGYHGVPQMPVFAYKAIADELVAIADTDALVNRFCGIGVNILYQRNEVGGHTAEFTNGAPAALDWLGTVLDGTYASVYNATGCTIENVAVGADTSPI